MIRAEFYIKVDKDGKQVPLMNTGNGDMGYLSNLAVGRMGSIDTVEKELMDIREVIEGVNEKHFLSYSESICLDIFQETTLVYDSLGNVFFNPFEIKTSDIYQLLIDWCNFLKFYKNGDIPGIIHPDKRDLV